MLPGKPTLTNLEKKYEKNLQLREPLKDLLKIKIDAALQQKPKSISALSKILLRESVLTVMRQNEAGKMYGITFVDNANRSVFNGSEVGRQYSVAGLLKQMNAPPEFMNTKTHQVAGNGLIEFNGLPVLAEVMKPEYEFNVTPYQLKKRKKKIKR